MKAYIKLIDKKSPIHEIIRGQEIKITTRLTKNDKGEEVPDFRHLLYRSEFDDNLSNIKDDIKTLKIKYNITDLEWFD